MSIFDKLKNTAKQAVNDTLGAVGKKKETLAQKCLTS